MNVLKLPVARLHKALTYRGHLAMSTYNFDATFIMFEDQRDYNHDLV